MSHPALVLTQAQVFLADRPLFAPIDRRIEAGEILTLMGPSGCGKSSLLAWLAGTGSLAGQGDAHLGDVNLTALAPHQRRLGLLFQDAMLFPHWSVGENVMFALPASVARAERRARVEALLSDAELSGFYERDPRTLSGGQQARIALLRTLAAEPLALLLDEPFSKLDQNLRERMRDWVFAQVLQRQIPVILVTHDDSDIPAGHAVMQLGAPHA